MRFPLIVRIFFGLRRVVYAFHAITHIDRIKNRATRRPFSFEGHASLKLQISHALGIDRGEGVPVGLFLVYRLERGGGDDDGDRQGQ